MRLLTITLYLLTLSAFAQTDQVFEVPGASASELYGKAERWAIDAFRDANAAIKMRDSTSKTVVAKGYNLTYYAIGKGIRSVYGQWPLEYSVEAACRDGRCRLRVYDARLNSWDFPMETACDTANYTLPNPTKAEQRAAEMGKQMYGQTCEQAKAIVAGIFASFKLAIEKPKDDW